MGRDLNLRTGARKFGQDPRDKCRVPYSNSKINALHNYKSSAISVKHSQAHSQRHRFIFWGATLNLGGTVIVKQLLS